jgi:hypothetical protein
LAAGAPASGPVFGISVGAVFSLVVVVVVVVWVPTDGGVLGGGELGGVDCAMASVEKMLNARTAKR